MGDELNGTAMFGRVSRQPMQMVAVSALLCLQEEIKEMNNQRLGPVGQMSCMDLDQLL